MTDILRELSEARRKDAEARAKTLSVAELERRVAALPATRGFAAALKGPGINVIAELKKASPSEGLIRGDFAAVPLAKELVAHGAAALSVLCEPHRFLGDEAYLAEVRREVSVPLLYKDFITTPYQVLAARAAGADAVLLIAAVLDDAELDGLRKYAASLGLDALVETHTREEIVRAVNLGCDLIGINCRDLRTFRTDPAITGDLIGLIPKDRVAVAESGLKTGADLAHLKSAGAAAFLIGTTLMRAQSPGEKLRELMEPNNR